MPHSSVEYRTLIKTWIFTETSIGSPSNSFGKLQLEFLQARAINSIAYSTLFSCFSSPCNFEYDFIIPNENSTDANRFIIWAMNDARSRTYVPSGESILISEYY